MFSSLCLVSFIAVASAFQNNVGRVSTTSLNAKSTSLPFLEKPPALNGKYPGDVGFDPVGFTSLWADKDWSQQVVPDIWPEAASRTPISTLDWMVEAELKHGRFCMMAVLGWVAVDLGVRFPGAGYESIPNSLAAHNAAVENGSLGFMLLAIGFLELIHGAALFDQAKGSGRKPGEFMFDPLNLGKDPKKRERYAVSEVKNGRLAMLAFSGIVTQAALFPDKTFPYF